MGFCMSSSSQEMREQFVAAFISCASNQPIQPPPCRPAYSLEREILDVGSMRRMHRGEEGGWGNAIRAKKEEVGKERSLKQSRGEFYGGITHPTPEKMATK